MSGKAPSTLSRGLGFVAGVGFSAVPAVGPFLAVIALFAGRVRWQRADWWWAVVALLYSLPYALTNEPGQAALSFLQFAAIWLVYRATGEARALMAGRSVTGGIAAGLVVGLLVTLLLGFDNVTELRWREARTILDAIEWGANPALFGHTILVLAAVVALVTPNGMARVLAMAVGAVGVVASGSLEAVFAWLLIFVGLRLYDRDGTNTTRVASWSLIFIMALIATGVASWLGLGRTGFLTDFTAQDPEQNIFRGTEVGSGDWWFPLGVSYRSQLVTVGESEVTSYVVTKRWPESWSRLQQVVTLTPGETYTVGVVVRPDDTNPGIDGWGRSSTSDVESNFGSTYVDGVHRGNATGELALVSTSAAMVDDEWLQLAATFRYDGDSPLTWYVGVVPDRSSSVGSVTEFAELQLTASYTLLPYREGLAERGVVNLRTSRFPIWRDALTAILARPLTGWGPGGLPAAITELRPAELLLRPVAAHAHNSYLDAWVSRGVAGALAIAGLLALLGLRAVQQRDHEAALVLTGVVVLTLFDSTLLSGSVCYPLAAVLGWRAAGPRAAARHETGALSSAAVRASLIIAGASAGFASLSLAMLVAARFGADVTVASGWSRSLLLLTLAWPAVAALFRLLPGYGLASHDELSRTVTAAVTAAVLVGFVAFLVPGGLGLPTSVYLLTVPFSAVLAPVARAVCKAALLGSRLWGRPVVMLGTSPDAARVARHLLANPSVGLTPVAAFGDEATEWGVRELPVSGPLETAWDHIAERDVHHAIVTSGAAVSAGFDGVLLRSGRQLRRVQFLPDLQGLPTNSVKAAPIGTALALEARNQLASPLNRFVKRAFDVLGSAVLLLLLAVPFLVLALLIRLDSPGPAFYRSPRIGRNGRTFDCVKFRTMYADADERLVDLMAADPAIRAEYEEFHKLENDPRVTRVGSFLRRTSIDELPQLINVLLGQMSLVGPRPYLTRELELMGPERDLIFLARPGMTGYWQVEARNDVSFEERQVMEAHYVRNWSVWWDVDILLRTPAAVLGKTGR